MIYLINSIWLNRMNYFLSQMWQVESDLINDHSNEILDKLNEVVSTNELAPAVIVVS